MIKKQDAIAALRKNYYSGLAASVVDNCIQAIQALPEETPVADAKPVRHGRWLAVEMEADLYECSICEYYILRSECNYCPNCGAFMRKGDANE